MRELWRVIRLDLAESFRARWFYVYALILASAIALLFAGGLANSRVFGFMGLSRVLLVFVQFCMGVVPILVLLTTVRTVVGDRESGVFEYLLSLPVSLGAWYWGKTLGRFLVVLLPILLAMGGGIVASLAQGHAVPWGVCAYYTALLAALGWCFLGMGMLLSSVARSLDMAQFSAFAIWLALILLLDLLLLGLMLREQWAPSAIVGVAMINPLQVFRTASMLVLDPQLILMGASAYVILDFFGRLGFLAWALVYLVGLGALFSGVGFWVFRRSDLL